jgi:dipeptidyl aminopeptidase/acylaminoacyl peptidase
MNGGEPRQLTHEKNGVGDFTWRPDGGALTYAATPESPDAKAIEQHQDAFNVTEEAWTEQSPTSTQQLYEISNSGRTKARHIGDGSWSVGGGFTYAADGKSLFVTRLTPGAYPNQYLSREIVRVDVASGAAAAIPRLSRVQADPFRSADGRHIAFSFSNPHGMMQTEIALANASAGDAVWLSRSLDRDIEDAAFLPDNSIVAVAGDGTHGRVFRLSGGAHTVLPLGDVNPTSGLAVAQNGAIAFAGATLSHPSELYVLQPHATSPQRLTNYNAWIGDYAVGRDATIVWRTRDGLTADGVLIYPPHWRAGQRAPLVLYIHGGPTAASLVSFSAFADVLAAHGWFVFEPNYRGSDNLGVAFARTTVPHIASVPGDDIEAGLNAVLRLGLIDPTRIAVSGWSEGGLMTSWLITHDTRWKAAVSGAAVNDWIGYAAMTDAKDFTPEFIGPKPYTDPSLLATYRDESPLTYADRVKTPTLILSDSGDYRVPTPLAYEFYHSVRATGTPVKFVIWPVVGHFPSDPVRSEDVNRQWEAWLVRYLR